MSFYSETDRQLENGADGAPETVASQGRAFEESQQFPPNVADW